MLGKGGSLREGGEPLVGRMPMLGKGGSLREGYEPAVGRNPLGWGGPGPQEGRVLLLRSNMTSDLTGNLRLATGNYLISPSSPNPE